MTHLPFIAASYGLAVVVLGWFGIGAWVRVGMARRRLGEIDPRRRLGEIDPRRRLGKIDPRRRLGEIDPRRRLGEIDPRRDRGGA